MPSKKTAQRLLGRRKTELWSLLLIFMVVLSCSKDGGSRTEHDTDSESGVGIKKKVLIIGIDGCRPDALMVAKTPNLDSLMANGTYSMDARNTGITMSGPGWSSMLSGVWPNKHNVIDNSYEGASFVSYPHFFKYIEDAKAEYRTVSVVNWAQINDYQASKEADVVLAEDSDAAVRNAVSYELLTNDPTAMFVQFDDVDHAGHATGFSPTNPDYIGAIENVDARIGSIMGALERRKNIKNEDWLIIVSTDHGGIGTSHGVDSDQERTIFLIVSGKNVPREEVKKTTNEVVERPAVNCLDSHKELYFDGTTRVEVADADDYVFGASQDFSIECRLRGVIPGDVGVLAKKNWDSGLLPGYVFSFKPR